MPSQPIENCTLFSTHKRNHNLYFTYTVHLGTSAALLVFTRADTINISKTERLKLGDSHR